MRNFTLPLFFVFSAALFPQTPISPSAPLSIATFAGADLSANPLLTLQDARGLALDPTSNTLFIADTARHRVLKLTPTGDLSIYAGTGAPGFFGDDGPATSAQLNSPYGLLTDPTNGTLFIADLGNGRIRRVRPDGRIHTVAGGGILPVTSTTASIDALQAEIKAPRNLARDAAGNLYISDFAGHRVLRLGTDARMLSIAGNGQSGPTTPVGPPATTPLSFPAGLFIDAAGSLWIADSGNHAIRRLAGGSLFTIPVPDGFVNLPTAVALDAAGNLFLASTGFSQGVRISASGAASVIARNVNDLILDSAGNIYVAAASQIRRFDPNGAVSTLAGSGEQFRGDGGPARNALFDSPSDIRSDYGRTFYIADTNNNRIRRIGPTGIVSTAASGLSAPRAVILDTAGNLFIADTGNHRIRRISAGDGQISTIAGTGVAGFNGEALPATEAQLSSPSSLAFDSDGNLIIADTGNHRIRRLTSSGLLMTIAGAGERGFGGDGTGAFLAKLDSPRALTVDRHGNLFFADAGNHRIRRISLMGAISTVAEGLADPSGLAVDDDGTLYVSDTGNHRLLRIVPGLAPTLLAGTGVAGFANDPGPANTAQLNQPAGLFLDSTGALYIADKGNHRIRRLTAQLVNAVTTTPPPAEPPPPPTPPNNTSIEIRTLHSATLAGTRLAPGLLLTIEGRDIGPTRPVAGTLSPSGALETTLADTQVLFNGSPAPIVYAQQHRLHVQAPYALTPGTTATIEVKRAGELRAQTTAPVEATAPGIFPNAATLEDGSLHSQANPAPVGSILTIHAAGTGAVTPTLAEGRLAETPVNPIAPLRVTIGGQPAELLSANIAITSPGVLQLKLRIPTQLTAGAHELLLEAGEATSQRGVTLYLQ